MIVWIVLFIEQKIAENSQVTLTAYALAFGDDCKKSGWEKYLFSQALAIFVIIKIIFVTSTTLSIIVHMTAFEIVVSNKWLPAEEDWAHSYH